MRKRKEFQDTLTEAVGTVQEVVYCFPKTACFRNMCLYIHRHGRLSGGYGTTGNGSFWRERWGEGSEGAEPSQSMLLAPANPTYVVFSNKINKGFWDVLLL